MLKSAPSIGTRIYYTGDKANNPAWGVVEDAKIPNRHSFAVRFEHRERLSILSFAQVGDIYQGHCDPRYVTESAYHDYYERRRNVVREQFNRMLAREADAKRRAGDDY